MGYDFVTSKHSQMASYDVVLSYTKQLDQPIHYGQIFVQA